MFGFKKEKEKMEQLNVFEVIPKTEQDMIRAWIESEGILYSGLKRPMASLDHVLRIWAQNKAPFYHMFGDKLIVSRRVDYECPMNELREKCYAEADSEVVNFIHNLGMIMRSYDNVIGKALHDAGLYSYEFYNEGIWDMLIDNKWPFCDVKVPMENGKYFVLKTGMRVTRIYQKLAEIAGISGFEKVRELHAKISTSKIVHGNMYLSIHPLDYMTMSDNEDGWDSCMNWRENGDYRAGTVEMLNSPVVIEAYMASDVNKMRIDGNEWPSKIWRELYIVHPEFISNIRSYPFINSGLSKFAVTWIKELAEQAGYGKYQSDMMVYGDEESSSYFDDFDLRIESNNMYNDYCREDQFVYVAPDFREKYRKDQFILNYSGPMSCMCCGEIMSSSLEETRAVMCGDCSDNSEEYYVCDYCGTEMYSEDDVYYVDGTTLCHECYCDPDTCGVGYDDEETHLISNMTKLYLGTPDHGNYVWIYDITWWLRHNDEGITKDKLKYVYDDPDNNWASKVLMLSIDDVTDEMLNTCGIWDREKYRQECHEDGEDSYETYSLPSWLSA